MNPVTSMVLRRMRVPFIVLITVYAISILGLVLIPGVDDQGQPWNMSIFHAFYFVSYTATTIGFGEIPYELTDAQRLWVLATIYMTVISWVYGLGTTLTLIQDPNFREAVIRNRFKRDINNISTPFYLICGFGETGNAVVEALIQEHYRAVVIDKNPDNLNELTLNELPEYVPCVTGDASDPDQLELSGIRHRLCRGVIAVTPSDEVNLKIAITSKLLHPDVRVVCRSELKEFEENMLSFGTDYIVNPFETFSSIFAMAMHSPALHLIYDWLTGAPNTKLSEPIYFRYGRWILCGYGRFGKQLFKHLRDNSIPTTIIDPSPQTQQDFLQEDNDDIHDFILGTGTNEDILRRAGAEKAAGLIAGGDNDSNNLSTIMTARAINQDIFVVARQNVLNNHALYTATNANLVMRPREIIARKIRVLFLTPLLIDFLAEAGEQDPQWANITISRLSAIVGDLRPHIWTVLINQSMTPAIAQALQYGRNIKLQHLISDPAVKNQQLQCVPLMLVRGDEHVLMPDEDHDIRAFDRILFCGAHEVHNSMRWTLTVMSSLNFVMTLQEEHLRLACYSPTPQEGRAAGKFTR
jgi:Trk K+ transport system NAD-binding subunit